LLGSKEKYVKENPFKLVTPNSSFSWGDQWGTIRADLCWRKVKLCDVSGVNVSAALGPESNYIYICICIWCIHLCSIFQKLPHHSTSPQRKIFEVCRNLGAASRTWESEVIPELVDDLHTGRLSWWLSFLWTGFITRICLLLVGKDERALHGTLWSADCKIKQQPTPILSAH